MRRHASLSILLAAFAVALPARGAVPVEPLPPPVAAADATATTDATATEDSARSLRSSAERIVERRFEMPPEHYAGAHPATPLQGADFALPPAT